MSITDKEFTCLTDDLIDERVLRAALLTMNKELVREVEALRSCKREDRREAFNRGFLEGRADALGIGDDHAF
jgi:hypothetical protein